MRNWRFLLLAAAAVLAACGSQPSVGAPAQIIFLRHAEKPDSGPELSDRGWARAKALPTLFAKDPGMLEHGPAVAIFAMKPTGKNGSVRAIQTMEATAQALDLKINRHYTRDEIGPLVHAILSTHTYDHKTVIVCWEHDAIPEMLKAFGWKDGPTHWPDKSYDRLWVLDFENGQPTRCRDLPQNLLPGDKAN